MNSLFNINKENNFSLFFSVIFHILILIFAYFIRIENGIIPISVIEIEFQNDKKVNDKKIHKIEVEKKIEKKKNIAKKKPKLNDKKNNKFKSKTVEPNKNIENQNSKSIDNINKNIAETDLILSEEKNAKFQSNTIDSNKNIGNQGNKNLNDTNQSPTIVWKWISGKNRKLLSGVIPEYPEGINVTRAKIKIKVTVRADGRIVKIFPIEKSNEKLVEIIIKEVKNWQFDILDISYPQINQECEITFNFKSK